MSPCDCGNAVVVQPLQHVSGRSAFDRWHTLWVAWVVDDLRSHKKLYFACDTRYRTMRGGEDEDKIQFALHLPRLESVSAALTSRYYLSGTRRNFLLIRPPKKFTPVCAIMWCTWSAYYVVKFTVHGSLRTQCGCSKTSIPRMPSPCIEIHSPLYFFGLASHLEPGL